MNLLTIEEVSGFYNLPLSILYTLLRKKKLNGVIGIRIMIDKTQVEHFLSGCGISYFASPDEHEAEEKMSLYKQKRLFASSVEYSYKVLSKPLSQGLKLSDELIEQLALMGIHTIGDLVRYTQKEGFERFYKEEPIDHFLIQELMEKMVDGGFYTVQLTSPLEKYI